MNTRFACLLAVLVPTVLFAGQPQTVGQLRKYADWNEPGPTAQPDAGPMSTDSEPPPAHITAIPSTAGSATTPSAGATAPPPAKSTATTPTGETPTKSLTTGAKPLPVQRTAADSTAGTLAKTSAAESAQPLDSSTAPSAAATSPKSSVTGATLPDMGSMKLPGAGGLLGGGSGKSNVDVNSLLTQQSGLMKRFGSAMKHMLAAQARTLEALGNKTKAEQLDRVAASLDSGSIESKDAIQRAMANTTEGGKIIAEELKKSAVISEEGKKQLRLAVPDYAVGTSDSIQLPPDFKTWVGSMQSGMSSLRTNPTQAMKLKDGAAAGLYVAENIPTLVSTWGQATKNFASFAKSNNVDVSKIDLSNII